MPRHQLPKFANGPDGAPNPALPLVWQKKGNREDARRARPVANRGWSTRRKATRLWPCDEYGRALRPARPRSPRAMQHAIAKARRPLRRTRAQRLADLRTFLPGATKTHLAVVDREAKRQLAATTS